MKSDIVIELKIGRHSYGITSEDEFMDNGTCVQLLTQSKERSTWGKRPNPLLSKRAVKELSGFLRKQHDHGYSANVQIFSIEKL